MKTAAKTRPLVECVIMPLLGSSVQWQEAFQYLLLNLNESEISITIPRWVASRAHLKTGERIHFHVPFLTAQGWSSVGEVVNFTMANDKHNRIYLLKFTDFHEPQKKPTIYLDNENLVVDTEDLAGMIEQNLKDMVLIKKAASIFLSHLAPYFFRVSEFPDKQYPQLKEVLYKDLEFKLNRNTVELENLWRMMAEEKKSAEDFFQLIDFEEFRQIVESEISVELFNVIFPTEYHLPYIRAIKDLENGLYNTYNAIVLAGIATL